ncbi:hypothetical protein E4U42_000278, partial [Claviceps africana]
MASDPGHKWEASTDSIHKPTSGQRLRLVLRSLFLAPAKSSGRALSLHSSACLESRAPFVKRCVCGVVQRARTRLSRHKHEDEDEDEDEDKNDKNHRHEYRLPDRAVPWTPAYSPSHFPSSGASRYSCAYLGGSRPSMSLERALRESERDEETREMYWPERDSSAYGDLEQNASRSSVDDEDLRQTPPSSSWIHLDAVASSPLVATFMDEYRTTIAPELDGRATSKSLADVDQENASRARKAHRREAACVPMRRRSVLQTPGVATRPPAEPTSGTRSATSQPSACVASVSVSLSPWPSTKRRTVKEGSGPGHETRQPRRSLCTDEAEDAIQRGAVSPPSAERPGVTEASSSSAAGDHISRQITSAGVSAASTPEAPAPSSKSTSGPRQPPLRPRHRLRQDTSAAAPRSRTWQLPFRRSSETAGALTKHANDDVPYERGLPPPGNHGNHDAEDSGARIRPSLTDHGSNRNDRVDGASDVGKCSGRLGQGAGLCPRPPLPGRVQGSTTNARVSPEASPLASATQARQPRGSHPGRPPKQPPPAAALSRFPQKRHPGRRQSHATTTTTTTTTTEAPRPVPPFTPSPTSHANIPSTTAHRLQPPPKTHPNP